MWKLIKPIKFPRQPLASAPADQSLPSIAKKELPQSKFKVVGKCPTCGEDVLEKAGTYDCRALHVSCDFRLRKRQLARMGKELLTAAEVALLLDDETIPLLGLLRRNGERFDAGGELEYTSDWGWRIRFVPVSRSFYSTGLRKQIVRAD